MKTIFILLFAILCQFTFAQNDACGGAIELIPSDDPAPVIVSFAGATYSPDIAESCGLETPDIWYKFTAAASMQQVYFRNPQFPGFPITNLMYSIYNGGNCTALTEIHCGQMDNDIVYSGLSIGQTYYLRVRAFPVSGIELSIKNIDPEDLAQNDEPENAIALAVSGDANCTPVTGQMFASSYNINSGVNQFNECIDGNSSDLWFSFTPTGTGNLIQAAGASLSVYTMNGAELTGVDFECGVSPLSVTADSLIPGQEYLLRLVKIPDNLAGFVGNVNTYSICITTITEPSNDICTDTQLVTASPNLVCGEEISVQFYNTNATPAAQLPACINDANSANEDLWYKFVATSTSHIVMASGFLLGDQIKIESFSGVCGGLVCTNYENTEQFPATYNHLMTDLTIGMTYFIRFVAGNSPHGLLGFEFCVKTPLSPPVNNEASGAIVLTPSNNLVDCNYLEQYSNGATLSEEEEPTCMLIPMMNSDVWYQFTATAPNHQLLIYNPANIDLLLISVLYDSQNGLPNEQVWCFGNELQGFANTPTTFQNYFNLTVGQTYFIRLYRNISATNIYTNALPYNICLKTLPEIPANTACASAVLLPTAQTDNYVSGYNTRADFSHSVAASADCNAYYFSAMNLLSDTWYKFVATQTVHKIRTINNATVPYPFSLNSTVSQYPLLLSVYSGTCGSFSIVECSVNANGQTLIDGLTPGQTYHVKVVYQSVRNFTTDFNFGILISDETTLETNEVEMKNFSLYPNPADNIISINSDESFAEYEIYNFNGQRILKGAHEDKNIDVSQFASGMYVIKLIGERTVSRKFVKR